MADDQTTTVLNSLEANNDFTSPLTSDRGSPGFLLPRFPQAVLDKLNKSLISEWTSRQGLYANYWDWFDSKPLQATDKASKAPIYPLEINPVQWVTLKHAGSLFGEIAGDAMDSLVGFSFVNADGKKDDLCARAASIVNTVWSESHAPEIQLEAGLVSQVTGGCVFHPTYYPDPTRSYPIQITHILPDFFFPVWDSQDKWRNLEAWQMHYISPEEALLKYGIDPRGQYRVLYLEHWTRDTFEVLVDGKPANMRLGNIPVKSVGMNKFGIVPYVYIPHLSRGGGYYGLSHIPGIVNLITELNSRMADRGDKVKAQSLDEYWVRNVIGNIKVRNIGQGVQVLDLGSAPPGSTKEPDMQVLDRNSITASGGKEYTDDMWTMICHASDTPLVAWGIDEGSQRSGMTLEIRFWPLTSHTRRERIMWGQGLGILNKMILQMLVTLKHPDVSEEMLSLRPRMEWEEILPRERQSLVEEMVQRKSVELVSTRNAVQKLARGEDVDTEMADIQSDREAMIQAKPAPYQASPG